MDATAEEVLKCLLNYESREGNRVDYEGNIFLEYVQFSIGIELEKLVQYGMIDNVMRYMSGGMLDLLPPALLYFKNKENALAWQKKHEGEKKMQNITN